MRSALNYLWYVYWSTGWLAVILVSWYDLSARWFYLILCFGLIFYLLKLHYINSLSITEVNYHTMAYYLVLYLYIFFVGVAIWDGIHWIFISANPEYFQQLFPTVALFYMVAKRTAMIGAMMSFSLFVTSGTHRSRKSLKFTNKVALLDVMLVIVSVCWVLVNPNYITMFIAVVTYVTMPGPVKAFFSRCINRVFKKDVDLVSRPIENNADSDITISTPKQYLIDVLLVLVGGILNGLQIQIPLALWTLLLGSVAMPL